MPTLYGDDGKGNVAESISVASDQKFSFKGYADKASDRIDVWFDQYSPYPPYDYVRSIWICTVYSNAQRYFQTYPYDLCWIHDTGQKDASGNKLWELYSSKGGKLWSGPIGTNLGFKATENNFPSKYAKVYPVAAKEIYELRIYFVTLPWANEAAGETILDTLAKTISPVIEPFGFKYQKIECNWGQNYYSLWFLKTGSPIGILAAALAIAGLIVAAMFALGLIYSGMAWLQQGKVLEQQTIDTTDFVHTLDDLLAKGIITPEQYAQMLSAYNQQKRDIEGIPWTNLMIVAVILGGMYLLAKAAGPAKEAAKEIV